MIILPKILSSRFCIKIILLGVVVRHILHHKCYGRILLEHVSTQGIVTKLTANTSFSDYMNVSCAIQAGEWNNVFTDIKLMPCSDVIGTRKITALIIQ